MWKLTVNSRFVLTLTLATLALCGCLGNSGSSTPPPNGVQLYPGDAAISVTWNYDPAIQYWIFYAQDPTLTTLNWSTNELLNAGVLTYVSSPSILCNGTFRTVINNPPPLNPLYPATYVTINGRTGSSPGGEGSSLVYTTPRAAGGPFSPWIAGDAIPAGNVTFNGLGYAALTSCGYSGRPPWGIYVAVGSGGAIYSSTLAPNVAGPLIASSGNVGMTWTQGNIPIGFSANLVSVAGVATSGNNPAAPNLLFAAVGNGGAMLRSVDGQNWALANGNPTSNNLNAVAWGGTAFIAVGDQGVVLTSPDGLTWTPSTNAATAEQNSAPNLNAIHCTANSCVAVGSNGATLWTSDSGAQWAMYTFGTNNWIGVAYGNQDANADDTAVVNFPVGGGVTITVQNEAINTWVVVDGSGNYAYATSTGGWIAGSSPIATSSVVGIDYTTRFLALDGSGNAWASENGINPFLLVGNSGITNPTSLRSNGQGYVALGVSGTNASSF